jgi:hypothetical protein
MPVLDRCDTDPARTELSKACVADLPGLLADEGANQAGVADASSEAVVVRPPECPAYEVDGSKRSGEPVRELVRVMVHVAALTLLWATLAVS